MIIGPNIFLLQIVFLEDEQHLQGAEINIWQDLYLFAHETKKLS